MFELRGVDFGFNKSAPILKGVSLTLREGEIVGLCGKSGAGKSTLGRIVAGHLNPDSGQVLLDGQAFAPGYRAVQYIHQSSIFAVNPRWRLGRIIAEAWEPDDVTLDAIGVSKSWFDRYPHEISGGELQRVVLVRSLSPQTRFLVADELSAMLDPITQVEIWSFLMRRRATELGILAISHDAALLKRVSSRQLELSGGRVKPVEGG